MPDAGATTRRSDAWLGGSSHDTDMTIEPERVATTAQDCPALPVSGFEVVVRQ
ncbi:protein of unknown function [Pararobbsia alpina]